MATASRQQPPWLPPAEPTGGARLPKLRIYNSLTREKNAFVPLDKEGKKVTWYACGPTVYDDSHIGHARNYVSTDVIRRIMRDYLGFHVNFVMNITDVDDKIIVRARQQYFLDQFKAQHKTVDDVARKTTQEAWKAFVTKNLPKLADAEPTDHDFQRRAWNTYELDENTDLAGLGATAEQAGKWLRDIRAAVAASTALIKAAAGPNLIDTDEFWPLADDVLLPYLWTLGDSTPFERDHTIFTDLTRKFEESFFEDMDRLNVLRPSRLTRVTEYVPQIVDYVEKIQDKQFAYASEDPKTQSSSVYFDISSFEKADGNAYARLEPSSRGNDDLQADGEGSLTKTNDKHSKSDFALWKASKKGEPSWHSDRWGGGRPGWHIECSVMASDVLGPHIDIHSGGIDLAFPHHDNELAQAEAYYSEGHQHQWINYFMHMGHLHIQGLKMSKSLKNFQTIKAALDSGEYTPRSMRLVFLLGAWKDTIEISPGMIKQAQSWEASVSYFFLKALDRQRSPSVRASNGTSPNTCKSELAEKLEAAKLDLNEALMDSFDTPRAMHIISSLLSDFNTAETAGKVSDQDTIATAQWITRIVSIFGLDPNGDLTDDKRVGWSGIEILEEAKLFVYPLSAMRDEIRQRARAPDFASKQLAPLLERYPAAASQQAAEAIEYAEAYSQTRDDLQDLVNRSAPAKDFLALSDKLRDVTLWDLGIYLEDQDLTNRPALVQPVNAELRRAREEKDKAKTEKDAKAGEKAQQKELALRERAEKQREKEEKARIKPEDLFRTAEYSEWTDEGMPTKDKEGKEVTKSALKKLQKQRQVQEKLHNEWLDRQKPA